MINVWRRALLIVVCCASSLTANAGWWEVWQAGMEFDPKNFEKCATQATYVSMVLGE